MSCWASVSESSTTQRALSVSKLGLGRGGLKDSRTSVNWISASGTQRTISGPFLSLCFLPVVRRATSSTGCCHGDSRPLKDRPRTDGGPDPTLNCASGTWPQRGKEWLIQCSNVSSSDVCSEHPRGLKRTKQITGKAMPPAATSGCTVSTLHKGWRAGKSRNPAPLLELCFLLISTRRIQNSRAVLTFSSHL